MPNPMKKHIKEKLFAFINALLIAGIATGIGITVLMLANAQAGEGEAAPSAVEEAAEPDQAYLDETQRCVNLMKTFMEVKRNEFGEFINTHFRSAKPSSELIPVAVERYRRYRDSVRTELNQISPADLVTAAASVGDAPSCVSAVEEDLKITKEFLRQHIIENAYAKKTTRLLDKYKELNGRLDKLNFTIAQMYGYFGSFSQALPCYASQCLK